MTKPITAQSALMKGQKPNNVLSFAAPGYPRETEHLISNLIMAGIGKTEADLQAIFDAKLPGAAVTVGDTGFVTVKYNGWTHITEFAGSGDAWANFGEKWDAAVTQLGGTPIKIGYTVDAAARSAAAKKGWETRRAAKTLNDEVLAVVKAHRGKTLIDLKASLRTRWPDAEVSFVHDGRGTTVTVQGQLFVIDITGTPTPPETVRFLPGDGTPGAKPVTWAVEPTEPTTMFAKFADVFAAILKRPKIGGR